MSDERWNGASPRKRRTWRLAWLAGMCIALGAMAAAQRDFATPEEAAATLVKTVKAQDRNGALAILGQDAAPWISSGDSAADRMAAARFVAAYDTHHAIARDGPDKASLLLGTDDFPFAFPLVRNGQRWRFDTAAGKEEMLARRIGENELAAINVLRAIVDAQMEYASVDRNGDGVLAYARKFASSPGKHDGLYWPTKAGEPDSPLGALLVQAAGEGYRQRNEGMTPYRGYFYRMLSGQGKHAASGEQDYAVQGRAIGGFAVLAYPARYGNSGVMTFMVNQDGKVYQSDLGPDTALKAGQMQLFDPGPGWTFVAAP